MDIIETKESKNYRVEVWYSDSDSPREWDNLGTMVCCHSRYTLGDRQDVDSCLFEMLEKVYGDTSKAESFENWHERKEIMDKVINSNQFIILPVYMYEHSGIVLSTGDFGDRWDSGQVGFIYVDKEKVRKEYSCKRVTKKVMEKVIKVLNGEVDVYSHYVDGNCYGYTLYEKQVSPITGHENEEEIDSCGGFIGDLWDIEHNNDFDLPEEIAKELA